MLTMEERIRALIGNLKNWDWTVYPQYRIEKEDSEALIKLLELPTVSQYYKALQKENV